MEKFLPRSRIPLECSCNRACYGDRMLLLYPTHHHAEVTCLDDDTDADGLQNRLQRIADLLTEAFLCLESTRVHVDDPWDLAEADDVLAWDIADMHFPGEGEEVVFAERVTLDVFDDDHPVGVGRKQRTVDDLFQVLIIPRCQKLHGFIAALRRALQPGTTRVFADFFEESFVEGFHEEGILS